LGRIHFVKVVPAEKKKNPLGGRGHCSLKETHMLTSEKEGKSNLKEPMQTRETLLGGGNQSQEKIMSNEGKKSLGKRELK